MSRPRRAGRWIALAAAGVAVAAIGLVIALRRAAPEAPAPPAPEERATAEPRPDAQPALPPPASDVEPAERLVASAKAEAAAGNLVQARALLARAYALDPRPATLLELGAVELQTGHCREARRAAQGVIAAAPGEPLAARAQDLLGEIGRCD